MPKRSRLRARARLFIVTAVTVPLLAPLANASAASTGWTPPTVEGNVAAVAPTSTVLVAAATTQAVAPTTVRLAASRRIVRHTLAQRVINEARRHFGARYQWGATGPSRFDCSGLTQYVFRKVGIRLPRTAEEQYYAVRHVSPAAKRVGDLIFRSSRAGGIHHVGIYAGHGMMINSPHSGAVVRLQRIRGRYLVGRVR